MNPRGIRRSHGRWRRCFGILLPNAIQQVVLPRTALDDDSIDADTIVSIDADTIDSIDAETIDSIDADTDDEDDNNQQDDICPAAKKTRRVHEW